MIETPFDIEESVFGGFDKARLIVPIGTAELYRAAEGWRNFLVIDERGIDPDNSGDVDFGNDELINDETNLNGNVIGNIYFNIADDAGSYSSAEGCINVVKPTADEPGELKIYGIEWGADEDEIESLTPDPSPKGEGSHPTATRYIVTSRVQTDCYSIFHHNWVAYVDFYNESNRLDAISGLLNRIRLSSRERYPRILTHRLVACFHTCLAVPPTCKHILTPFEKASKQVHFLLKRQI